MTLIGGGVRYGLSLPFSSDVTYIAVHEIFNRRSGVRIGHRDPFCVAGWSRTLY